MASNAIVPYKDDNLPAKQGKRQRVVLSGLSVNDFQQLGADIMKRGTRGSVTKFNHRWKAHFGVDIDVVTECWDLLDVENDEEVPSGIEGSHLLWALLFLKRYNGDAELSSLVGGNNAVDEGTFAKWVWVIIERIESLFDEVVSFYL